jgi:hypothetical protein
MPGQIPLYMEGMMPGTSWMQYADGNVDFANWLERLDELCSNLIDMRFMDLIEVSDFDPHDAFFHQVCKPEVYLQECVIPSLVVNHGAEFIYELIAANVLYGANGPPPYDP